MAFNPSKEVAIARDAAEKLHADRCIVLFTKSDGTIGYASYGQTKQRCDSARKMADVAYDAVMSAAQSGQLILTF